MSTTRDPEAYLRARQELLQYLRRVPDRTYRVGFISIWLRGGYPLERTEELLLELVNEGILVQALEQNQQVFRLAEGALQKLPKDNNLHGILC